jgi:hypothetical protein
VLTCRFGNTERLAEAGIRSARRQCVCPFCPIGRIMAAMNTPRLDYHSSSLRLPRYVVLLLATGALLACSAKKSAAGDASTASMSGDECDPNAGSASASLLTNGSFEQPPVPAGGFTVFSTGDTFGGWTVMGDPGNVAPLSTTFSGGDFSFPAEDGQQSVDMTGTSQSLTGISQTVATMPGHTLPVLLGGKHRRSGRRLRHQQHHQCSGRRFHGDRRDERG